MNYEYQCPKCKGFLNVGGNVIFSLGSGNKELGLILLHPEFGDYSIIKHESIKFTPGEIFIFSCPLCHHNLQSGIHPNLAEVNVIDEKGNIYRVLFSKIAGEKSTYKILGDRLEVFGDDSANYMDFVDVLKLSE